jgi:Tfp pilus assembly protein PilF
MTNKSSETNNQMSGSSPPGEDTAQTLNIRGYRYLLKGEAVKALRYFQRALSLAPDSPVILNNMGNALFNLNRFDEAQDAYKQAIEASHDYLKPYRNLALLYQLQGRNNEAISVYRQYLNLVPKDGEALHNMGLLYMAERRTSKATEAFEVAAEHLLPTDAESATNLGVGYFYRGNLNSALELLEHALVMDPSFVPARYHLGVTYLHQGRCRSSTCGCQSGCGIQHGGHAGKSHYHF